MPHDPQPNRSPESNAPAASGATPLSLDRLRAAFAQMLGQSDKEVGRTEPGVDGKGATPASQRPVPTADPCEISPRSVIEAMLFVGRPDNEPFSARQLAAAMRGVSPAEVEAAVAELNCVYRRDEAPYEVVGSAQHGFQLALCSELHRMRDKLYGRTREAKLTPAAVEVLSIVAYNEPTTVEAINRLRAAPSGPILSSLVRRKLVRVERPADRREPATYSTTDRFLQLFGLESTAALPRSEELEKL